MIGEYDCRKFLTKNLRRLLEGHLCAATSAIKTLEIPISMGFFAKYCRASCAFISELNISLLGLIYLCPHQARFSYFQNTSVST